MRLVQLSDQRRRQLREVVQSDSDAEKVRRAEAILLLDAGVGPTVVAKRFGIGRRTVYDWVDAYGGPGRRSLSERLSPRRQPGRPPEKRKPVRRIASRLLKQPPSRYGYLQSDWTANLIQRHLSEWHGVQASLKTVRRALRSLDLRYKRPRYVLARRSPTWRQAKGG